MLNHELENLVVATGELAALPHTVVQLLDLLKDATCSAAKVVRVMERDPAMTANVLKLSNSAFYGVRREIGSVRDALVMLGNRSVVTLAFATGMAPVMRRDLEGYGISRDRFWGHSLKVAAASAMITEWLGRDDLRCEAFTAGLVHDIGMLAIDKHLVAIRETIPDAAPMFCVSGLEQAKLGFDHAEIGAVLAAAWGFPEILVAPIRDHHQPYRPGPYQAVVQAVAIGNVLAQAVDEGLDLAADPTVQESLGGHDIDGRLLHQLSLDLSENLEQTLARATRPACGQV